MPMFNCNNVCLGLTGDSALHTKVATLENRCKDLRSDNADLRTENARLKAELKEQTERANSLEWQLGQYDDGLI